MKNLASSGKSSTRIQKRTYQDGVCDCVREIAITLDVAYKPPHKSMQIGMGNDGSSIALLNHFTFILHHILENNRKEKEEIHTSDSSPSLLVSSVSSLTLPCGQCYRFCNEEEWENKLTSSVLHQSSLEIRGQRGGESAPTLLSSSLSPSSDWLNINKYL
jgi:hypothetical protein